MNNPSSDASKPFLTDVQTLRARARKHIEEGGITPSYQGDVKKTIEILQAVLATHAKEEQEHAMEVAERINQLGGKPDFNPSGLASRSASEYGNAGNLVDMIKENLIAERIAVEHYRELIRYFGDRDPSTRHMLERILAVEEEHANDMHDLLVAHEGHPMLEK